MNLNNNGKNAATTIKIATLTGAAKDDVFLSSVTQNNVGENSAKLNVLANDPGAAKLYSVWQPTEPPIGTPASSGQMPVVNTSILPSGATITMNDDGTISYDAGSGFQDLSEGETRNDTFSYTVRMANGVLSTATVIVAIQGVNDDPVTSAVTLEAIAEDSAPRLITQAELLVNASDVDGDLLSATGLAIASGNGALTDNGDGTWSYAPALNDDTSVSFSYTVEDGNGGSVAGSASLDITPVNDAPTTSAVTLAAVDEDNIRTITQADLLVNASDVDGGVLVATGLAIVSGNGVLTDNGDGTWSYAPALNDDTSVSFSYTVEDGNGGSVAGSASLDITPDDDLQVGFNDLDPSIEVSGELPLVADYMGLNWSVPILNSLYVIDGDVYIDSGFSDAGSNVAKTDQSLTITRSDSGDFDFVGVEIISALDPLQTVTFEGWLDGVLIYSDIIDINNINVTSVTEDWGAIDALIIENTGTHVVFDNFSFIML